MNSTKSYKTPRQRRFWRQKIISYFVLRYDNVVCYNRISSCSQFEEAIPAQFSSQRQEAERLRSHSKHFEISVSQSKKSKCLGLAEKTSK